MKLDVLKALIRLANNNPSEHEANAAARKVCKEITEQQIEQVRPKPIKTAYGKMNEATLKEWVDPATGDINIKITSLDIHNSANGGVIEALKLLKRAIEQPKTWNDVKRSSEPAWKPNPPKKEAYDSTFYDEAYDFKKGFSEDFFKDLFNRAGVKFGGFKSAPTDNQWTDAEAERKRNEEKREQHTSNYSGDFYTNFKGGQRGGKRRQELRVCSKCGLEIMTFRIKENPWVCAPCHWGAGKKEPIP
jgi:hypothetical protein